MTTHCEIKPKWLTKTVGVRSTRLKAIKPVRISRVKTVWSIKYVSGTFVEQKSRNYLKMIRNWENNYAITIEQINTLLSFCSQHNPSFNNSILPFLDHRFKENKRFFHSQNGRYNFPVIEKFQGTSKMIFKNKMWCFLNQFMVFQG